MNKINQEKRLILFRSILIFSVLGLISGIKAQSRDLYYELAREKLIDMLSGKAPLNLSNAVYWVEDAWYDDGLNESLFKEQINKYADFCKAISLANPINYIGKDATSVNIQAAVFAFMTDSIPMQSGDSIVYHPPFQYNYDDFAGEKDWRSMFVTTLMATGKGNCHSMPLLYKLIMDELGEKCWLALAPNHLYIKARTQRSGWYNIELTTGDFPTDAWLMASGYIHLDAVRNGIYTDTLSLKQSVAMCLTDLAQGYMHKYGTDGGKFVEECCNMTLLYYPNYINALLIKAELLTVRYKRIEDKTSREAKELKSKVNAAYSTIHRLGYRRMPEEMYLKWINSMKTSGSMPFGRD